MSRRSMWIGQLTRVLEGRWDLILLMAYSLLVLIMVYPDIGGSDQYWASPLLLFGSGYPISCFYDRSRLVSGRRISLSVMVSCTITLLVFFAASQDVRWTIIGSVTITLLTSLVQGWMRSAGHIQEASTSGRRLLASWDRFISIDRKKRFAWLITATILVMLLISIWSITNTPPATEKYTEFYITGPDGMAESIPGDIVAGRNYSVLVGLANHEGRIINYYIQVWLVDSRTENNYTSVLSAYYIGSFATRLISIEPAPEGEWRFQWETKFTFNIDVNGTYKLWFLLSKNGEPVFQEGLVGMEDYAGPEIEGLINQARLFEIQSLNLNLRISE